jgi:hypothetical protein
MTEKERTFQPHMLLPVSLPGKSTHAQKFSVPQFICLIWGRCTASEHRASAYRRGCAGEAPEQFRSKNPGNNMVESPKASRLTGCPRARLVGTNILKNHTVTLNSLGAMLLHIWFPKSGSHLLGPTWRRAFPSPCEYANALLHTYTFCLNPFCRGPWEVFQASSTATTVWLSVNHALDTTH